ncbi:MAG: endo alpha-1,4 polygalactosaminidase [Eggerthellaceae bacterium]|jgi:hypothetical protein
MKTIHLQKRTILFIIISVIACIALMALSACSSCSNQSSQSGESSAASQNSTQGNSQGDDQTDFVYEYGVFIALDPEHAQKLGAYHTVVIDALVWSQEDIQALHDEGHTVYSYLNVGSLENWRSYYDEFKDVTTGERDGWEDESWVDVTNSEWQAFVTGTLAQELADKGVDGFFVDNLDVYSENPSDEYYQALITILNDLHQYNVPIMVNGADEFVVAALDDHQTNLFNSVNQEEVFTQMNGSPYDHIVQTEEATEYYEDYLERCRQEGLAVYLTEYNAPEDMIDSINNYCDTNGFIWYNAPNVELKG